METDVLTIIESSRECGVVFLDERRHLGVDLKSVDPPRLEKDRLQDVGAATGADDEDARPPQKVIRQCRG